MSLFKSKKDKTEIPPEDLIKNWTETTESKFGLTREQASKVKKLFEQGLIDATDLEGVISDYSAIDAIFYDLNPVQKTLVLYYGRWLEGSPFSYTK